LRGRVRGRNGAADLDVQRDRKRTGCLVIGLAVIGVLGILVLGEQTFNWVAEFYVELLFYFVVALLFLAGLSTLIVFLRSSGNPGASGVRRVIVGDLTIAGGLVILGGLTILALFIYISVVCKNITEGKTFG
jgi:hypothetical protein